MNTLGWVVKAGLRRTGHPDIVLYISDKPPVGLSKLQEARFFTDYDDARRTGYWQHGEPVAAIKQPGGRIRIRD